MPNFLKPIHESNDCHNPEGPGGGQFCSDGGSSPSKPAPKLNPTQQRMMDRVNQQGHYYLQVGVEARRNFGQGKLAQLRKLVQMGLLTEEPRSVMGGLSPIMSRARWMNNKTRGWSAEYVFRKAK